VRHITRNEVILRARGRTNIAYYLSLSTMQSRAHTYRNIDHTRALYRECIAKCNRACLKVYR